MWVKDKVKDIKVHLKFSCRPENLLEISERLVLWEFSDFVRIHDRGQTNTDNPAEYGYIRNRIVPLGMKQISIWTIRYSFDTLRNRSIENPVPFYPLRNTYKNYPFQTDNQTDNKLPRSAKSLKDDMAKKTLSEPKFSLRKCSLRESMFSNDPW